MRGPFILECSLLVAGLFGHKHAAVPPTVDRTYHQWMQIVVQWCVAHWQVLAVVIPVAGALVAGIMNHYLAVARENRSRRLSRADVQARVFADLSVRLLHHCSALQSVMRGGQADLDAWKERNAALRGRSDSDDVIESLGKNYVGFVAAIEYERRALGDVGRREPRFIAREVVRHYVPFIADFGESEQARRLRKIAR